MQLKRSFFVIALTTFSFVACNNSSGQATPAFSKDQIKGAWQMSAVGDRNGNVISMAQSNSGESIQLSITDTDFRILIYDDRGLKDDNSEKYTFDGKHIGLA